MIVTVQSHWIRLSYLASTGSEQTGRSHGELNKQAGPSRKDPFMQSQWDESGQGLTFIGDQVNFGEFIVSLAFDSSSHSFEKL